MLMLSPFAYAERMSAQFFFGGTLWIGFIGLAISILLFFTNEKSWVSNVSLCITLALCWLWILYIEDVLKFFGVFA